VRPKLITIFLLIVLVPVALLGWLGLRVARDEQEIVEHKFRNILLGKLGDVDATVAGLMADRERELLRLTGNGAADAASLRALARTSPIVQQTMLLDPHGVRLHPPPAGPLNEDERAFLRRAEPIWRDPQAFFRPPDDAPPPRAALPDHGWHVWYWGEGIHIIFWRRAPSGHVAGMELSRVRLLADIVGALPATDPLEPALPQGRVVLADAKGGAIYQWGAYEPAKGETPQASRSLAHPLEAWQLRYFASNTDLKRAVGGGILVTVVAGTIVVAVALVGLGIYIARETSREMREAAQRVNFVNQVSHELKTPLTNIRLYAELLETAPPDPDRRARYLGVIVAESQRLSRLIGNVLTFARKQRHKLALRPAAGRVDERIAAVIEHFRPSLAAKGVDIAFDAQAGEPVIFDADALEQILGNLFYNVEKYAADGGQMSVASRQNGAMTTIEVADRGPGIPRGQEERIFEPFRRLSNKLADGVTGTGIGLAIARDLARLHGGDLRLLPSDLGARFELTLHTPRTQEATAQP